MNSNDANKNGSIGSSLQHEELLRPEDSELPISGSKADEGSKDEPTTRFPRSFATRADIKNGDSVGKGKLLLLGGGLAAAVLFFVFTAIVGKSPQKRVAGKQPAQQQTQQGTSRPKSSVTPIMETVHTPAPNNAAGQLEPADILRTRSADTTTVGRPAPLPAQTPAIAKPVAASSLGNVPSFEETQQKWEEPRPYGEAPAAAPLQTEQQNSLKEASMVFVRHQVETQPLSATKVNSEDDAPLLEITPGTRIEAKLETQISSAVQVPVVAVVEYTYAIGDRIVVPAGARVYGQLQQADRSGLVDVKFNEIQMLDGVSEKIDAIGTGLDLGPIKGNVYGKNTGKNFLVRAASGLGSVLAEIAGNNSSAAFSEDDMLRERVAENIGTAGDSEVMNLNANSRIVVSVPADTKIYVVFTKHQLSSSELHKVATSTP